MRDLFFFSTVSGGGFYMDLNIHMFTFETFVLAVVAVVVVEAFLSLFQFKSVVTYPVFSCEFYIKRNGCLNSTPKKTEFLFKPQKKKPKTNCQKLNTCATKNKQK